jgi:DNA modification methylase
MNPIQVTKEMILIAGANRLSACKALCWTEIPAVIVDYTPEQAELAEIDENLIRNELTALERSEQVARRKELYEILFPGATKSAKSKANLAGTPSEVPSFSCDTAEKAKCTQRAIQLDVQITSKLSREIRDEIRNMPIADNQSELLALARRQPTEQRAVIDMVKSGLVKKVGEAISLQRRNEIDSSPEEAEPVEGVDFVFSAGITLGRYEDVVQSYPDGSVDLVLTDPPYSVNVNGERWDRNFDPKPLMVEISRILSDTGSALVFCNDVLLGTYLSNTAGLTLRQIFHWHKTNRNPVPLDGPTGINKYLDSVEYILWFTKSDKFTFNPCNIDTDMCSTVKTTLFQTPQCSGNERLTGVNGRALHPCQKPVKLIEALLLTHSNRGDRVCDLFLGTGTTAEVATRHERSFWGCEMDPKFHDISVKRAMSVLGSYKEPVADEWDEYYESGDVVREFDWSEEKELRFQAEMERMRGEFLAGRLPSWVGNAVADMEKAVVNG